MLIGFLGDVHGRVLHALAVVTTWQERAGRPLDLVVQLGDMGAYPDVERMDAATRRYLEVDPSEADFGRLLRDEIEPRGALLRIREGLTRPVHFLRGNHEDLRWLRGLPLGSAGTAAVDPLGLLRYVPDGTVLEIGGARVAVLGGIERARSPESGAIDRQAYASLMQRPAGSVDVLATHEGPYGVSVGFRGDVQGSRLISALIEQLQPSFHLAAHTELSKPRALGRTTSMSLNDLVPSPRWQPDARAFQRGCLAVLDTGAGRLEPVMDPWPEALAIPFDFQAWGEGLLR